MPALMLFQAETVPSPIQNNIQLIERPCMSYKFSIYKNCL